MAAYSFKDVTASLVGAGGNLSIGAGNANADEGIEIEYAEDKNMMQMGADGEGQHSLIAADHGSIKLTLLKTSPLNARLQDMYNIQKQSSSLWGQNIITVRHNVIGDFIIAQSCAFKKATPIKYAKEAGTNEWVFDSLKIDRKLGGN